VKHLLTEIDALRERLSNADARIAELEADCARYQRLEFDKGEQLVTASLRVAALENQIGQALAERDAANARADAAERGWAAAKRETAQWRAACERAESEAAALRAEVGLRADSEEEWARRAHNAEADRDAANAHADAAERAADTWRKNYEEKRNELNAAEALASRKAALQLRKDEEYDRRADRAESEAAALRATIARLRAWYVEQVEYQYRRAISDSLIKRFDEITRGE